MTQHYFIGISIALPVSEIAEQFRLKFGLKEKYKVIPHADDLHITLRYIGSMDEEKLPWLTAALQKTAKDHSRFDVSVTGMSFFGSPSGPRVVYLAVEKTNALSELQRQVARRTEKILQMEKDNRFVPHITIAKKRKTFDKMQLTKETIESFTFRAEGFTLYRIHPKSRPSYEPVKFFPLKKD